MSQLGQKSPTQVIRNDNVFNKYNV